MRRQTLPLGVDIGTARVRVALVERVHPGRHNLVAVATRPAAPDASVALADAVAELGTRERSCVMAIGAPAAQLRLSTLPPLRSRERERAARFEAMRGIGYPAEDATVRVVPLDAGTCVVGVVPRALLQARVAMAKRAGLRARAVDHAAFGFARAFTHADAVVDIGETATTLIVREAQVPSTRVFAIGGRALTDAVADALGIDVAAAEQRKCIVGLAGAGEHARDALIEQLTAALVETRAAGRFDVRAVALTGNGARLAGFADALERAVALPVTLGALEPDAARDLPADVVRSASPDWALAYGLALWELAA